jgi:hypothetical protein
VTCRNQTWFESVILKLQNESRCHDMISCSDMSLHKGRDLCHMKPSLYFARVYCMLCVLLIIINSAELNSAHVPNLLFDKLPTSQRYDFKLKIQM